MAEAPRTRTSLQPTEPVNHVIRRTGTFGKPRLLACACARYRWSGHVEDEYRRPVAAAEQCADGLPSGTGDNFNDAAIPGLIAKIAEARVLTSRSSDWRSRAPRAPSATSGSTHLRGI